MRGKSLFILRSQQKAAVISRQYEECELRIDRSLFALLRFERPNDCRNAGRSRGAIFVLPADHQQCGGLRSAGNTSLAAL